MRATSNEHDNRNRTGPSGPPAPELAALDGRRKRRRTPTGGDGPLGRAPADERLYDGLGNLTGLQVYVLAGVDIAGLTEREVAVELTRSRGEPFSRDRVHRIRLTAHARLRRHLLGTAS